MWKEFHYGCCYYPEAWDAARRASDITRIARAGFNVVRMGEGAWSYWEPREGEFQFELFDRVIDLCKKHGIKVIMGTPTYAAPAWVSTNYPEVLRRDVNRVLMQHGSRRNFNYTSPKYLDLSDKICTALAEHYKNEKQIIGWQLDNEFNCHMDVSYAASDTIAFRAWLRQKYRTLDGLNRAWGTGFWSQTYSDWDQIDLPHPTPAVQNPHRLLDETRFISDCVVRFAARQAAILRRANPRWQITHNGLFANVNGSDLAGVLDFWSHDQYPLFWREGDWPGYANKVIEARSLSFPYVVMEQQSGPGGQASYLKRTPRPGEMRLFAWQSIAHGAKGLLYFRWRTCPYGAEQHWHGLLEPDNRDNRRLAEAKQVGEEIRSLPAAFFDAPVTRCVAVMRDFDCEANDRRINTYVGAGQWEPQRWLSAWQRRHVPVDVVWSGSSLAGYRLLIAPHLAIMDPPLAAQLLTYVRAGGTLVLGAQSATFDKNLHTISNPPPGLLRALTGVEVIDWTTLAEKEFRTARLADGREIALTTFVERLRLRGAKPLAHWTDDDTLLAGAPAITQRRVGKGCVIYVGGYLDEGVGTLANILMQIVNILPVVQGSDRIEAIERRAGKRTFLILLNHDKTLQPVTLPKGRTWISAKTKLADGDTMMPPRSMAIIEVKK